jgi:hypothetical protein
MYYVAESQDVSTYATAAAACLGVEPDDVRATAFNIVDDSGAAYHFKVGNKRVGWIFRIEFVRLVRDPQRDGAKLLADILEREERRE